ncbi:MAG: DUF58 domain-containing protein [Clostridiaceae bacterium]|jgi:uncharacterized protein (DUF58 family)|nr:DUF58 domain-containing protein [Clostridiaceae bacterium]
MRKSRIRYLVILFLAFVYILFDGGFLPYTLFYITLFLPVVSFIYLIIVYNTFTFSERLDKREYRKGEILDYTLKIHNVTPLNIPYFTVYMHMEGQMLISGMKTEHLVLKPFSHREFHFSVPILYRGRYKIGISYIEIRDFLNLFKLKYAMGETKFIRVFPRILTLEEQNIPFIRISENEYLSRKKDMGHSEIDNIRDYMYGDSLKKIHWKLSSKYNKFMTKETHSSSEKEFWIIINFEEILGEAEYVLRIEDRTIEVLVSLARVFLSAGIVLKICFFRKEQMTLVYPDINAFNQLYELFAFIPFDQKESFNDVMDYFIASMPECQSVMVFSPVVDESCLDSIVKMHGNGHDISLFYCDVSDQMKCEVEKALAEELSELGIRVFKMFENMKEFDDMPDTKAV